MGIGYIDAMGNTWEIRTNGDKLFKIDIVSEKLQEQLTPYTIECKKQLEEYFQGKRMNFSLDYELSGTIFQKQVWEALADIPYGQVVSYSDIANKVDRPKAVRAVGQAIHCNPLAILLPCHRVIGKNGKMVGFGYGIPLKERLLNFEQENRLVKDTRSR